VPYKKNACGRVFRLLSIKRCLWGFLSSKRKTFFIPFFKFINWYIRQSIYPFWACSLLNLCEIILEYYKSWSFNPQQPSPASFCGVFIQVFLFPPPVNSSNPLSVFCSLDILLLTFFTLFLRINIEQQEESDVYYWIDNYGTEQKFCSNYFVKSDIFLSLKNDLIYFETTNKTIRNLDVCRLFSSLAWRRGYLLQSSE